MSIHATNPLIDEFKFLRSLTVAFIWLLVRYQIINKSIFFILLFPLYMFCIDWLIRSTGYETLSSGNIKQVLLTPEGLVIGVLSFAIVLVAIATDITAFVLIEATRQCTGKLPRARDVFINSFKTLPRYLHIGSILLVAYVAIVVPLSGFGISVDIFSGIEIPNFISSTIKNTTSYHIIYIILVTVFSIIGILGIFTFQAVVLENKNPWQGVKRSFSLVYHHGLSLIKPFSIWLLVAAILTTITVSGTLFIALIPELIDLDLDTRRYWTTAISFIGIGFITLVTVLFPPVIVQQLTYHFIRITNDESRKIVNIALETPHLFPKADTNTSRHPMRSLFLLGMVGLIGIGFASFPISQEFSKAIDYRNSFNIIAHRAGGDLGPENSLEGLEAAIEKGIPWSEVDIQRTKDNQYIINHDSTFKRLSDSDLTSMDLTLNEATKLPVKNLFDEGAEPGHIASLEDLLNLSQGKIKLFLELKGTTADEQMVDDVAAIIKARGMQDQAVIASLDYDIIRYAEETYPEIETGYMYFFSIGEMGDVIGDYLIMEESAATDQRVRTLKAEGRKVVVWTVNTEDSLEKLLFLPIDGIISDHPELIAQALHESKQVTDFQSLVSYIFSFQ